MKDKLVKFTCYDCKRTLEGRPTSVLRHSETGAGVARQTVCQRCLFLDNPGKRGKP